MNRNRPDKGAAGALGVWLPYLGKIAAVFGLLLAYGLLAPSLPEFAIFALWAALTLYLAVASEYHVVVRKAYKQVKFKKDGVFGRWNNGRVTTLVLWSLLSAVCAAALLVECAVWNAFEWGLVIAGALLFPLLFECVDARFRREYKPLFRLSMSLKGSCIVATVVLVACYVAISALAPEGAPETARRALDAARDPFAGTSSVLLSYVGQFAAVYNGFMSYGVSKLGEASFWIFILIKAVLCVSAFWAVSSLFGACRLSFSDLKHVFLDLDALKHPDEGRRPTARFVVAAAVVPALILCGMPLLGHYIDEKYRMGELALADSILGEGVDTAVYLVDGGVYRRVELDRYRAEKRAEANEIATEAISTLTPMVEEVSERRMGNIDAYLDWYYGSTASLESLGRFLEQMSGKDVEDGMKDAFAEIIDRDTGYDELQERYGEYRERLERCKEDYLAHLSEYEVYDAPEWMRATAEERDYSFLLEPFAASSEVFDALDAGVVSRMQPIDVAGRLYENPAFKNACDELTEALQKGDLLSGGDVVKDVVTIIRSTPGILASFAALKISEPFTRELLSTVISTQIGADKAAALASVQALRLLVI